MGLKFLLVVVFFTYSLGSSIKGILFKSELGLINEI